ncbi:MAG: S8 family serine peptidase, partial [Calditrichae bacterium]|nr:S8 family serine peptidase [Calditrichia bacterium]NIW80143.1 S8 family serine peptidase [Calditrichia bacterium]
LLRDAIQYGVSRGLIFVSSAGNSGNTTLNYPAAFDQTISVGATNSQNSLASFSSYGSTINLVAPGLEIYAP